jgi:hypothetical protein
MKKPAEHRRPTFAKQTISDPVLPSAAPIQPVRESSFRWRAPKLPIRELSFKWGTQNTELWAILDSHPQATLSDRTKQQVTALVGC